MPLFPPWTQTVVILLVFLAGWGVMLREWRRRKGGIEGFLKTYRRGDEAERSFQKGMALAKKRRASIRGTERERKLSALRWEMLGQLHLDRQRYQEAIECFETGLRDWASHGAFHRAIAETWLRRGNGPAEALKWAEMAVAEERAEPATSPWLHETNLGEAGDAGMGSR